MNNQTLNEINKRDIDKCYFSISFYHYTIYFNDGNDYIYKRKVYTLIGCNMYNYVDLIIDKLNDKSNKIVKDLYDNMSTYQKKYF